MQDVDCVGSHHYYAAETGVVADEGKIVVISVCTACGEGKLLEFVVAKPGPNSVQLIRNRQHDKVT